MKKTILTKDNYGEVLHMCRRSKSRTQVELANYLDLNFSTISKLERCEQGQQVVVLLRALEFLGYKVEVTEVVDEDK